MARYTVTVVDTTGIQPYIFGSNRLQENIGASELVRLATGEWALASLTSVLHSHNVEDVATGKLKDKFQIELEQSDQAAEVIYAGGGNVVMLFRSDQTARKFARTLTRKVLDKAPGLSVVVVHDDDFEWNTPSQEHDRPLSSVVQELIGKKLAAHKASRLPSIPSLGLGVTAACESTGMVATRTNEGLKLSKDEDTRPISREVAAKLQARDWANTRLRDLFESELEVWYDFPSDTDKLGRIKGEESYVAVVHADGNGMGKRIKKIAEAHPNPEDNRRYIEAMRDFSHKVDDAATEALRHVVRLLIQNIEWDRSGKETVAGRIPMDGTFLPFRPLVFGGDDVTFLCNAQVGLALAAAYLEAYESEAKNRGLKNMHACAGIAIVKMHYPFARAYVLSAELAKSAKSYVREKYGEQQDASALDWHFATSGLSGSLRTIRAREYSLPGKGSFLMRPLLLRPEINDQDGRAWFERIEKLVRIFQTDKVWSKKRNKVKALREALREGSPAVKAFRRAFELDELPNILPDQKTYQEDGWAGDRCGYFDAIELYDHYLRLELVEVQR